METNEGGVPGDAGTTESPPGTREYPPSEEGRDSPGSTNVVSSEWDEADPKLRAKVEEGLSHDRPWAAEGKWFWETFAASRGIRYADDVLSHHLWAEHAWLDRPSPPTPRPPGDPTLPARTGLGLVRQVGVKLTDEDHRRIHLAARTYGLTTSQLARLLVKRGVDTILAEEGQ